MPYKKKKQNKQNNNNNKKQLATKQYVKRMIRKDVETKYIDAQWPSGGGFKTLDWSATNNFVVLSSMNQNFSDTTRIGDKITMRSLHIRLMFNFLSSTPFFTYPIRFIVFQWYPTTSLVLPTPSRILVPAYLGTVNAPLSPIIHDYECNFVILYDKIYSLNSDSPSHMAYHIKVSLKYAKKTICFDGGSTDAGNHIYAMCLTNSAISADSATCAIVSRFYYDDA